VDAFVLAMYQLQGYYANEIERGLAGLGNYRLRECYAGEAKTVDELQVCCSY